MRWGASSSSEAPKPRPPPSTSRRLARDSEADTSAPASAPTPKLALSNPNTSGPEASVCAASTGSSTLKLIASVEITSISTSTSRTVGVRHA